MTENSEKETRDVKVVDNTQWRERHQFVLSANGNIICQRYFKVNGFNNDSIHSEELYHTFRDAVKLIKRDLEAKSRIYCGITMRNRSKLTGFYKFGDEVNYEDAVNVCSYCNEGNVELSNGDVIEKTYIDFENEETDDDEPFVFKFSYLMDDKVMYEEVWDGKVYPKYVRNSVDLSNSSMSYRNADPMRMTFGQQMTKYLTEGRQDLIWTIIKMFCGVMSNYSDEDGNQAEREYTMRMEYGDKKYLCNPYPRDYVRAWGNAVRSKTIKYNRWCEYDLPESKIDYINRL